MPGRTPWRLADLDGRRPGGNPRDGRGPRPGAVDLVEEEPYAWKGRRRAPKLHTSPNGRFAAVVTDYGRYGTVVDLSTGRTALSLDRSESHVEGTPFPVAFVGAGEQTVVVTATDWNRLGAFAPATGESLTGRERTLRPEGERRYEDYGDHFPGTLHPSPGGIHLLDDGWRWPYVGTPEIVDVAAWLASETDATDHARVLGHRSDAWDQPAAWIDEETIAIQRIGPAGDAMIDGVELYDAKTARPTGMFAGPAGRMWANEGLLYVATETGLEIWNPEEESRTGLLPDDFRPTAHNPRTGTFAEPADNRLRTWTPTP